jgi:ATP-dependent exoDNAse (exonuclease V) alpha subunit
MALTKEQIIESIERAKQIVADAKARKLEKEALSEAVRKEALGLKPAAALPTAPPTHAITNKDGSLMEWNPEQQNAIDHAYFGKSFCLIGAAGTGKTTTLKAILANLLENHRIPPLHISTKNLSAGAPGVALISYTRRAVRNIAKQMPLDLKEHCITFHKLVEYEPFYYEEWEEDTGKMINKMRFQPARNRMNPLPSTLKLIVVDESSMLSIDYFNELLAALPDPSQVQFIFLGDLNQLPPVYGQAILGKKLLELPIIELTRVYRQALESPIIALALAVKDNNFDTITSETHGNVFAIEPATIGIDYKQIASKVSIAKAGRGKITLHPWKKVLDKEDALHAMQQQLGLWIRDGVYDPEQDLVLCPWNKSFGTDELNLAIADYISRTEGKKVYEVIAGFNKYYYAVGDKLLIDKQEAIIVDISRNPRYLGKWPQPASTTLNRWGNGGTANGTDLFDDTLSDHDIDMMLLHAADVVDRTSEASHAIRVRFIDSDNEEVISKSATLNASTFAYAITVHKAQGSECRRVFFLTHSCHAAMMSRELVYTAITRAAEELYIVMEPKALAKSASKPRIKGDTLSAKLEFFSSRMSEKAD